MATKIIPHIMSGGINVSKGRHLVPEGQFWSMVNFKPDAGRLIETPRVDRDFALSAIYGQAASPVRQIRLVRDLTGTMRYLVIDQKTARYVDCENFSQIPIPVILQTAVGNDSTVGGECVMWGFNVTDFAVAGDTFEVNTVDAANARWRKNGGGWTSFPAGTEVLLSLNGLKIGFQSTTLVPGLTWKWQRSDVHPYIGAESTTVNLPHYDSAMYANDLYIAGIERNVMRLRDGFLTSVGYKRVYGKYCVVYHQHLVVGQYAPGVWDIVTGVKDSFVAGVTPITIGWSHLENPDQFFSTNLNEADQYTIPEQASSDFSHLGITGMEVWNNYVFIFLADAIYAMSYVGLPTVMRTEQVNGAIGSVFQRGVVRTPQGLYFIGKGGIYLISGSAPESIGQNVFKQFRSLWLKPNDTRFQRLFGWYNPDLQEVNWLFYTIVGARYHAAILVYQESTKEWYFRAVPTADTSIAGPDIFTASPRYNDFGMNVYGGAATDSYIFRDVSTPSTTTYRELHDGTIPKFAQPTVETFWMYNADMFTEKETNGLYVDVSWLGGGQFQVWYDAKLGVLGDGASSYSGPVIMTGTEPEKMCSLPRLPFRYLTYKFTVFNDNTNVNLPHHTVFNGYQDNLYYTGSKE